MEEDQSDTVDDPGRKESQLLLRNKMSSKYLEDVIAQAGLDYDEAVEMIEREKKAIDNKDSGFLQSLDMIIGEDYPTSKESNGNTFDRLYGVNTFLNSTEHLLKLNRKANRAFSEGSQGPTSHAAYHQARKDEQQRVKEILAAGKRIYENDLDAVDQQAKAKQLMGGNGEVAAQATAVFGSDRKRLDSVLETDKTLKYMQKGVKKMTKGLD